MKKRKLLWLAIAGLGAWLAVSAQPVKIVIEKGQRPVLAVPDFRGDGQAQQYMGAFNQTLWGDLEGAGEFQMAPKTSYPTRIPQQPADFQTPPEVVPQTRRGQQIQVPQTGNGLWMTDWSGPPVAANYLAFGYTAVQNGVLVLRGWLYDLSRPTPAAAQVIGKTYLAATVDEAGARQVAHQFAADIIALFGGKSLFGTHIYFVSNRTGHKEIWVMDPDGKNQRQLTHFNSISIEPAVSPDGTKIAFTSYHNGNPDIFIFSVDPVRNLHFYNPVASMNAYPSFTPDGKQIVFATSAGGNCCRIAVADLNGSGFRPLTAGAFINAEPKVNPKTGAEMAFVSGRSGPQQIYRMNMDGADVERLSEGTGEASNPAWHPNGQVLAFSWTRGFAAGDWNIFLMEVGSHRVVAQLTHSQGRNENPSWAPDGTHLAFMSTRNGGRYQIWTMLADGSGAQQLTTQGQNETPVWGN